MVLIDTTDNEYIVEFEIEDPKLISVNDQYMHPVRKTKRGSYVSYFAPSPYLKEVHSFYNDILNKKIREGDISELKSRIVKKGDGLEFSMIIGMPLKDIIDTDSSNYIKAIEDCVVKRTGIDDKYNLKVSSEKMIYENEGHWILKIIIKSYKSKYYGGISNNEN